MGVIFERPDEFQCRKSHFEGIKNYDLLSIAWKGVENVLAALFQDIEKVSMVKWGNNLNF